MSDRAAYSLARPRRGDGRRTVGRLASTRLLASCDVCSWSARGDGSAVQAALHTQTTGHDARAVTVRTIRMRVE